MSVRWWGVIIIVVVVIAGCVRQTVRVESPNGYVCVDDTKAIVFSSVKCEDAGMVPHEKQSRLDG